MFPVECVARGYLTGSGLLDYRAHRRGLRHRAAAGPRGRLPAARSRSSRRPPRPTLGDHDENVSYEAVVDDRRRRRRRAAARPDPRGLRAGPRGSPASAGSSWPTPSFEFGSPRPTAPRCSADEVLTPDSSRFWPAAEWQPGRAQPSYDKQIVRNWLHLAGVRLGPRLRAARRRRCPPRWSSGPGPVRRGVRAPDRRAVLTSWRFSVSVDVEAPVARVFDYLAEPRTAPPGSRACAGSSCSPTAPPASAPAGTTSPGRGCAR